MVLGLPSGLLCSLLLAQVEPAPADPAAPPPAAVPQPAPAVAPAVPAEPSLADRAFFLGLGLGGGHRLAPAGEQLPPAYGMSVATVFGCRYHTLSMGTSTVELGGAVHFDYQRYTRTVNIPLSASTPEMTIEDLRTVSYYDFAALQTVALPLGRLRLMAALGAGLAIGHFFTLEPALRPGESRMVRPLLRGSVGADGAMGPEDGRLGIGLGMTMVLFEPSFSTAQGQRLQVFGDRLSANLTYSYDF